MNLYEYFEYIFIMYKFIVNKQVRELCSEQRMLAASKRCKVVLRNKESGAGGVLCHC